MNKTRLEAFSDGVLAIIITIMVLEIKIPHEAGIQALLKLTPVFISYLLSFAFIAIYWMNHHHLLHMVKHVNTKIMWANMALLFSLSLVPFSTGWMGENHYAQLPVTCYCINLLVCGFGAYLLGNAVTSGLPQDDKVFEILRRNNKKVVFSVIFYLIAIACAFFYPKISLLFIAIVAVAWIIPDKNIEKLLNNH